MAEATAKERILEALRNLPPDASIDEGLTELDAGQGVPHEEVKRRFGA